MIYKLTRVYQRLDDVLAKSIISKDRICADAPVDVFSFFLSFNISTSNLSCSSALARETAQHERHRESKTNSTRTLSKYQMRLRFVSASLFEHNSPQNWQCETARSNFISRSLRRYIPTVPLFADIPASTLIEFQGVKNREIGRSHGTGRDAT